MHTHGRGTLTLYIYGGCASISDSQNPMIILSLSRRLSKKPAGFLFCFVPPEVPFSLVPAPARAFALFLRQRHVVLAKHGHKRPQKRPQACVCTSIVYFALGRYSQSCFREVGDRAMVHGPRTA